MKRLANIWTYLRQPIQAPWWIVCILTRHRWGGWVAMRPGAIRQSQKLMRTCERCQASMFVMRGEILSPTWRALMEQWLCALRLGGHPWSAWTRMRRQTSVTKGTHRRTLGRQCEHCGRFEIKVEEQRL